MDAVIVKQSGDASSFAPLKPFFAHMEEFQLPPNTTDHRFLEVAGAADLLLVPTHFEGDAAAGSSDPGAWGNRLIDQVRSNRTADFELLLGRCGTVPVRNPAYSGLFHWDPGNLGELVSVLGSNLQLVRRRLSRYDWAGRRGLPILVIDDDAANARLIYFLGQDHCPGTKFVTWLATACAATDDKTVEQFLLEVRRTPYLGLIADVQFCRNDEGHRESSLGNRLVNAFMEAQPGAFVLRHTGSDYTTLPAAYMGGGLLKKPQEFGDPSVLNVIADFLVPATEYAA